VGIVVMCVYIEYITGEELYCVYNVVYHTHIQMFMLNSHTTVVEQVSMLHTGSLA